MAVIWEANGSYTVKHKGQYVFNGTRAQAWKHQEALLKPLVNNESIGNRRQMARDKDGRPVGEGKAS